MDKIVLRKLLRTLLIGIIIYVIYLALATIASGLILTLIAVACIVFFVLFVIDEFELLKD